jgi:hypothetical protein
MICGERPGATTSISESGMEKLAAEFRPAYWLFAELSQMDRSANLVQLHFCCNSRLA